MMRSFRQLRVGLLLAAMSLAAGHAEAVTVKVDYSLDTNAFFPAGSSARATLEAAATYYSNILSDTLAAIDPPNYTSPRVSIDWTWTMSFSHPSAEFTAELVDQTIPADEYRIFAGARVHTDTTLAVGGPGGYEWGRPPIPNNAISTDITQIHAIDMAFDDAIKHRAETSGFAAWGGSISFDTDTNWHLNHATAPPDGKTDLYSVAIHELGHVFGFGASTEFTNLISGSNFTGAAAMASLPGPVPLTSDRGHWAAGTTSTIFGTGLSQTAIMTASFPPATRRGLTALDAAALTDIGWSVIPPPTLPGDYNKNFVVDAADFVVWRNTVGQSVAPGSGADGSGNGAIGPEDYTLWRSKFGTVATGSGSGVLAPEPEGLGWAMIGYSVAVSARRKRRLEMAFGS